MSQIILKDVSRSFERAKMDTGMWNSVKGLFFRRTEQIQAIKNVSFEIAKGQIVGLIGANGAGKSTLIKMMTGLIKPTSGTISIAGHVPHLKRAAFLHNIGVVLGQKNQLWWDLSPYETFILNRDIYEIDHHQFERTVNDLSARLNVEHVLKSPVRKLSLGERMKCELISSLLHQPGILFLDEPTIGLDFVAQKNIRAFLSDYSKNNGTTILLTSHYLPDIEELCEDVIIMNQGQVYYKGKLAKLKANNQHFRYISFSVQEEIDEQWFRQWGEIVELADQTVKLKIPHDQTQAVVRAVIQTLSVVDYHVEEMTTQDLLEEIFHDQAKEPVFQPV
ncbi:ATP-binding cassette domain-containing protein [Paenibacillus thiaminolyticus]|uniref:ATP-binding cassette domain-containing protein n=1 Tax=Paenibacillus thiaminolyticus TaxID=49283 RepID=A0A3A3GQ17_PANTH|nr:ATP-binding cassette domain-containing protein [Paenibacillus thiaminolyticus]RJG26261.1 ATP-binding cassette domain-containing protein [Paenibacillus thiaminolyticus]